MKPAWLTLLLCAAFGAPSWAQSHAATNNKLVEFHRVGDWEIWCLRLENTGRVECNLNYVLRYKDHPDFRAMIPRVFVRDGKPEMHWGTEWQTDLERGSLALGEEEPLRFDNCDKPCVRKGAWLSRLIQFARSNDEAKLRFYDYIVQEFEEAIPLIGLRDGVPLLLQLQARYDGL
ncbi:MAG: hypothetical protein AAF458_03605 [Pseudomonadota bacterium]